MTRRFAPIRHFDFFRRFLKDRSGVSVVEFALVASVFFSVMFGLIDLARIIMAQNALSQGVREAARYAIVHGSSSSSPAAASDIQTAVGTNAQPMLQPAAITSTASFSPNNNPGSTVTVQASTTWTPLVSFVPWPSITLTASSVLTIQN
jgi:Flp pilus assembly protein TadG